MIPRYLEYAYLLGAIGLSAFLALSYEELPLGNKIMLGLGTMICGFMYSFRRKQRMMLDELDRKREEEEAETDENPEPDER